MSLIQRQKVEEEEEEIQTKSNAELINPMVQRQTEEKEEEKIQTNPYSNQLTASVQRQVGEEEEEEPIMTKDISGSAHQINNDLSNKLDRSRRYGQPLPEVERSFMERRFGTDFSDVKVHTDNRATQLSRELNARAFTHGKDIFFNRGQYNPATFSGKHLLAHELTHVVQQTGSVQNQQILLTRIDEGFPLCKYPNNTNVETNLLPSVSASGTSGKPRAHTLDQTNNLKNYQTLASQTAPTMPDQKEEIDKPGNIKPTASSASSSVLVEHDKSQNTSKSRIINPGSFSIISRVIPILTMPVVPQIQRRAIPSLAPTDLSCATMDVSGTSGELDLLFSQNQATLNPANRVLVENYVGIWVTGGLSADLTISGYASKEGRQRHNWRLSCERAEAVQAELIRIGVPRDKTEPLWAHGETEDFDNTNLEPNRRATIESTPGTWPTIDSVLTPMDNFAGRSTTRFGLGESIWLDYNASPHIRAAEHFGVQWALVTGTGTVFNSPLIPAFYAAGNTPATEQLALEVSAGPAAGTRLMVANVPIIAPLLSYMRQRGTALCHTTGTAGVGFRGNIFMLPSDVSFNNLQWQEGGGAGRASGSLSGLNRRAHPPTATPKAIGTGSIATGCQVNGVDTVSTMTSRPNFSLGSFLGLTPRDWSGFFLWPIQWQFRAPGGPLVTYMIANHICTIDPAGTAIITKAGAGPFSRALSDPTSCLPAIGTIPIHCC